MPGRDLLVRIRADVTDFRNKMRLAQGQIAEFDKNAQKSTSKSGKALQALGLSYRGVGVLAGTAVAGIGGAMVKAAADFDQSMSNVKATGADAVKNIDALRKAALKAGADTKYSATEAAGGVEALAKAGVTSADILGGGLSGALDLAAAGNLDVAGSAEAAASALNQFQLQGKDVPHIADLLAAGAGKAQGEVSDMAMALNQAGLIAHGAGATLEETTGTLAAFASAGLIGSDAGTSFKTMLQRLQAPTGESKKLMDKLNISAYDAHGNFVGLADIAGQLRDAFKGQSDEARAAALATIFGSDAVRGANVLYAQGEGGIKKWTKAVDDSGYAAQVAHTKMDNLKGDLENLRGSIETLLIKSGEGSQGGLRGATRDTTSFVNKLGELNKAWDDVLKKLHLDTPTIKFAGPGFFDYLDALKKVSSISGKTGVKQEVIAKFSTEGAPRAIADATKVAEAAKLTPKEVKSVLRLLGWRTTSIDAVVAAMDKADRKQVVAYLKLQGFSDKDIKAYFDKLDGKGKKGHDVKVTPKVDPKAVDDFLKGGGIKAPKVKPTIDPKSKGALQKAIDDFRQKKPLPFKVDDRAARSTVDSFVSWANSQSATVYVGTSGPGASHLFTGGVVGFAGGGKVPGIPPSDPRKDNVAARTQHGTPYAIRSGEWIINERASRLNDRLLRAINSGADFSGYRGMAGGGRAGASDSAPAAMYAELVNPTVRVEDNGLVRLVDSRVRVGVAGNSFHQSSRARANNG